MFTTLVFQNLNELIESKVGNLPPPEPFHAVKVQGFRTSVSNRRQRSVASFQCQSFRWLETWR